MVNSLYLYDAFVTSGYSKSFALLLIHPFLYTHTTHSWPDTIKASFRVGVLPSGNYLEFNSADLGHHFFVDSVHRIEWSRRIEEVGYTYKFHTHTQTRKLIQEVIVATNICKQVESNTEAHPGKEWGTLFYVKYYWHCLVPVSLSGQLLYGCIKSDFRALRCVCFMFCVCVWKNEWSSVVDETINYFRQGCWRND